MLPRLPRSRLAATVFVALALTLCACSSDGGGESNVATTTPQGSTVVTAGAALEGGSDSCATPTLITANGTSSGATGGNSDKHGSNALGAVKGGGAPDAVWRVVLAKNGRLTVRSNGMGHF